MASLRCRAWLLLVVLPVIACVASTGFAAEPITHAAIEEEGRLLLVAIAGTQTRWRAPEGKYWEDLVVTADKQKAFVRLLRGSPSTGFYHEDVHEFSAADFAAGPAPYKLRAIPLLSSLDKASVQKIFAASLDGSRLLVSVHYCYARPTAESRSYRLHPYFFDTRTGQVSIVEP